MPARRCADSGEGNLLACAVEAARARATVGEISEALEKVWGRYQAQIRSISGVYGGHFADDADWIVTDDRVHPLHPAILPAPLYFLPL